LGFSTTTSADLHVCSAHRFTEKCPGCDTRPAYLNGAPVAALGEMVICPTCGTCYRWQELYSFDLSALFVELKRTHGWTFARDTCDRQGEIWGRAIGALQDYAPTR